MRKNSRGYIDQGGGSHIGRRRAVLKRKENLGAIPHDKKARATISINPSVGFGLGEVAQSDSGIKGERT